MFRRITESDPSRAAELFRLHPVELNALLELAWEFRVWAQNEELGHPDRRSDIPELPDYLLNLFRPFAEDNRNLFTASDGEEVGGRQGSVRWDHLIYAYMIENTRIYEIFQRVLQEFLYGEQLGIPKDSRHWLRNTEELFYKDPPHFFITSLTSYIRPDLRASRRNAYFRMFGMDLNHGTDDSKPYPFSKPRTANTDFVTMFEEFLREVWVGISNEKNTSGTNPTDDATITNLAQKLHDMLMARRQYGNLSREEFFFVSTMAWFHLTVEFNSPIVEDLRAEAASPKERLDKIAGRVGLPAHGNSKSFFDLADPLSRILIQIETGTYNDEAAVSTLYTSGPVQDDMRIIITHWSITTGHDLKTRKVSIAG